MKSNLVIVPAGDNSLHSNWLGNHQQFDLVTIYYGNSDGKYNKYKSESKLTTKSKGEKWHLLHKFIKENKELLNSYEYIWFPDDDLNTNVSDINLLFEISKDFKLWLAQPSISGYVSHKIGKNVQNSSLRFSNFVEIICPLMQKDIVFKLQKYFNINESGWGLDFLWPKILNYPSDKIAIIDAVIVEHTRPTGTNYSRFKKSPWDELNDIFNEYKITPDSGLFRIYSTIPRSGIWTKYTTLR